MRLYPLFCETFSKWINYFSEKILINTLFSLFVIHLFAISPALAKPVITGVSGISGHGKAIQIKGRDFGYKDPARPLIWADFEDGRIGPSPLGQRTCWNAIDNLEVTENNQSGNSAFNVVGVWESKENKKSFSFRIDKTISQGYWSKIYHYQKRYFNFDVTANQKFWRLWPASGGNNYLAIWMGEGRCYNETEGYAGGVVGSYQGTSPEKNKWFIEEFIWQHSGGSGKNLDGSKRWIDPENHSKGYYSGIWDYTRNGVQNQHRDNVDNGQKNHTQLRTDNFTDSRHLAPDGSKVYMDDIYIDDTYARVMVGDQKTLSASTHREIQIPSAWSDSSITVTVNQGSFSEGDTAYLYVVDPEGNVSNGFPIIIGGEGSPYKSPPPPPGWRRGSDMDPGLVFLPQGIDLTRHTMEPFTLKVRVEGIGEQRASSIFPRVTYYIGTGDSHGYFDMIHEGDNVWSFDIPDQNWYEHRSNTLHYQVKLFDEVGNVITESRWQKELIDSFVKD